MNGESESFFSRTLEQKTSEARVAVDECVKQYLAHNSNNRQPAAQKALATIDRVSDMLHPDDHPAWLTDLQRELQAAEAHSSNDNGTNAVRRIASELYPKLMQHEWKVGTAESPTGFEFDSIFEKYRSECRIPELFDELVKHLEEIVTSGAIDSVTAIRELRKVIATLQAARTGSFFATRSAWYFVAVWLKNTGWELLGGIPVAGSAVKGLRKTLQETDVQMKVLHESIQADLEQQIASDFPRLEYHPPALPQIEGPKNGDDSATPKTAK